MVCSCRCMVVKLDWALRNVDVWKRDGRASLRELVCGGTIPKLEKNGAFYSTQNNRKDGYKATIWSNKASFHKIIHTKAISLFLGWQTVIKGPAISLFLMTDNYQRSCHFTFLVTQLPTVLPLHYTRKISDKTFDNCLSSGIVKWQDLCIVNAPHGTI
jgi:hypothetical protein